MKLTLLAAMALLAAPAALAESLPEAVARRPALTLALIGTR